MPQPELTKKEQVRLAAEADLELFINLVHPGRVLGNVHREVINWWTREGAFQHQLLLLPRDHMKSALVAYKVAWRLTKDPTIRVLYISSTSNLATKQLKFIKDILTCDAYRYYWPQMVNEDESKREKWTEREISVDDPRRKAEAIRDPSIFTAGLTTGVVGLHCDVAVLDDVVVWDNAYTADGRDKVLTQYSLLASIESANSEQWVVGTRYDPRDLYNDMIETYVDQYDAEGNVEAQTPLYEVFQRQVEDRGDGTGQFLWPRQRRSDGKWFGFDDNILAQKRAKFKNKAQFRAQYYNDPNSSDDANFSREVFQYYDRGYLKREGGVWTFNGRRLNVFASIDFAFSLSRAADYTSLVVVGVDSQNNYYILDISRFKTDKISDYFKEILRLYETWGYRKLRAEVVAAQSVIVKDLKENYIKPYGLAISVDDYRPSGKEGSKEERTYAILQPRYENRQVWHYEGGNCQILEEELLLQRPAHDDVKDALASCIDVCVPPSSSQHRTRDVQSSLGGFINSRFGGVNSR